MVFYLKCILLLQVMTGVVVTAKICTKLSIHIIPKEVKDSNNQLGLKENTTVTLVENYCCEGYYNVSNTCKPYCKNVCLNGDCIEPDICECHSGYKWNKQTNLCEPKCEISNYIFNSLKNRCLPICSSKCENGICIAPDKCECNEDYKMSNTTLQCEPVCRTECKNGKCNASDKCECHKGYEFNTIAMQCEPICQSKCENGKCIAPDNCKCNSNFYFDNFSLKCEPDTSKECKKGYKLENSTKICQPICSTNCKNGGQGKCIAPEKCICNSGYILNSETSTCKPVCKKYCRNGTCIAPGKCKCHPGFKLNSLTKRCTRFLYDTSSKIEDHFSPEIFSSSIRCKNDERYNESLKICQPLCNNGCRNGTCIAANTCICNSGYMDSTTQTCKISVCLTPCTNGYCDSGKCSCNPGFVKSLGGHQCEKMYSYYSKIITGVIAIGLVITLVIITILKFCTTERFYQLKSKVFYKDTQN